MKPFFFSLRASSFLTGHAPPSFDKREGEREGEEGRFIPRTPHAGQTRGEKEVGAITYEYIRTSAIAVAAAAHAPRTRPRTRTPPLPCCAWGREGVVVQLSPQHAMLPLPAEPVVCAVLDRRFLGPYLDPPPPPFSPRKGKSSKFY